MQDYASLPINTATFPRNLKIELSSTPIQQSDAETVVLSFFSPADKAAALTLSSSLTDYDKKLDGAVSEIIEQEKFKGAVGVTALARVSSKAPKKVAVLGLGAPFSHSLHAQAYCKIGAGLAAVAKTAKTKTVAVQLPNELTARGLQSVLEAFFLSISIDNRFRTGDKQVKEPPIETLSLHFEAPRPAEYSQAVLDSRCVAEGCMYARDLVTAPANYCNTVSLAKSVVDTARALGLEARVLGLEECTALKMGSYLAVGRGSQHPPQFIHATYKPPSKALKKLAVIGKGVCFDSGGYNIKVAMMELMKFDMGGAAATFGAMKAVGLLKPANVEVHFISAACENMIDNNAYRPSDVITAANGKTIEVTNTDAEGRLTLADALIYAERLGVDAIVDLATLTGACITALGVKYAGMWSSDDALATKLSTCAKVAGENLWQMPLVADYTEDLKSKCADLQNANLAGKGYGGSIVAALFLKEFVEKTPWAHIDMAGPVWDWKEGQGTGYGVRLLAQWIAEEGRTAGSMTEAQSAMHSG